MAVRLELDPERCGGFHLLLEDLSGLFRLLLRRLDQKLVMDLKDELRFHFFLGKPLCHTDHGDLYDVRSSPLDRTVHRDTLPEISLHKVRGLEFGNRTSAAEQGDGIPLLLRRIHEIVQKCPDRRIGKKILVNIILCFLPGNGKSL